MVILGGGADITMGINGGGCEKMESKKEPSYTNLAMKHFFLEKATEPSFTHVTVKPGTYFGKASNTWSMKLWYFLQKYSESLQK